MNIAMLKDWRRLLAGATLLVVIVGLAWVVGAPDVKQAIPVGALGRSASRVVPVGTPSLCRG
jgi:hypothetical protein